jgi:enediyne biosynthesis protein E4
LEASSLKTANRVLLGLAALVVAALAIFLGQRWSARDAAPARLPGFRDDAAASGIDFQMGFLPDEQGETFRVNLYDHGCGVAVADYDDDGHDDLLLLNQLGGNALYHNQGDGTFENVTEQAGPVALADRICVGAAFGDYDNDGDQDVYITSVRGGNVLLENVGKGRFRDVTERAGVACVAHSQTPAFFDYDNDGDLDLFVSNTAHWTTDEFDQPSHHYRGAEDLWSRVYDVRQREQNRLFRNEGEGVFTDVTDDAGLAGKGWSGDVAAFDYDEDGNLDLFVTNMFGMSQLYRNDGQGHFDDVTLDTLGHTSFGAIGSKAFDFNNDGRLDLFVADMHSDMWMEHHEHQAVEPRRKYEHRAGPKADADPSVVAKEQAVADRLGVDFGEVVFGNTLFRNEGGGRFSEVSDSAVMETFWPWGVATGDFDHDGNVDVFLPSGMGYPYFYWPCALMMNNGDETFTDRAEEEGIEPPPGGQFLPGKVGGQPAARSSRCAATADFDGDGRVDLVVNNFNDGPYYFRNQFAPRSWVAFRLRGTKSNRDAVGAVVKLYCGRDVLVRQVDATGGYLSQSSKTLNFGLGDTRQIDRVEIRWPSGQRQELDSPELGKLHQVVEPEVIEPEDAET